MWLQSPILKENWKALSFNYSKDTGEMVDRLILESDKFTQKRIKKGTLTNQDYDDISANFKVIFR
ncbi:hypothetical protein N7U66_15550 [Lacinutrix neustonica]|uniref:Uncharacterized protein n=1 Tax=Lacinutrix neustonica TaxID=2980107 RepID=A0A9E8MUZ2_9FLAO|nr:hypothetical protein [Lacinutrix neustonica]WAC01435.1 hypothetical protein N7U66_15550 [Lacinutrix neustonica]